MVIYIDDLQDMNGIALSFSHHSLETATVSSVKPHSADANRYLFACLIMAWSRSSYSVLNTLKKYARSGSLPFGSLAGMNRMNVGSSAILGCRFETLNSSKWGTVTNLTSFSLRNAFESLRTAFRMSFVSIDFGGVYSYRLSVNYIEIVSGLN